MTVEERLARIETALEAHTDNDTMQFEGLKAIMERTEQKLDALRLAEAGRAAVASQSKRSAGILGGSVAAFFVGAVEVAKYLLK